MATEVQQSQGAPPQKPAPKRAPPSAAKTLYLIFYNTFSAMLWTIVLGRTVGAYSMRGPEFVFPATGTFVKWTQTLMIMDVIHAALAIVPSSPVTTLAQVASRYNIIWAIQHPYPQLCRSPIYTSMLFAWSLTEVIRYGYLALKLGGWEPYPLFWVRYSSYRVLYPVGILSEMGMMLFALTEPDHKASPHGKMYAGVMGVCLVLVWPAGAWVLIGHMNRQRRKLMRAARERRSEEVARKGQ